LEAVPDNPPDVRQEIYVGDKVIQTKERLRPNVMNGETGVVILKDATRDAIVRYLHPSRSTPGPM